MSHKNQLDHNIIIVGNGISGISSAIALSRAGIDDFLILEAAKEAGGVWRENTYPGVACDIPSILYQFKDERNPDWSKLYVGGKEIIQYLKAVQDKYGLQQKTRYNAAIANAEFDEANSLWQVTTAQGEVLRCRYLIKATGAFNSPKIPDLPGRDDFQGELFHSARWPEGLDLTGKRVAVIGTGASAIQLVPIVADTAAELTVYQRTPIWLLPKPDLNVSAPMRWGIKHIPGMHQLYHRMTYRSIGHFLSVILVSSGKHPRLHKLMEAAGRWNIRHQLKDPELIEKFMPDYNLGCKRPSFSNNYYRTFEKTNVHLNTAGIAKLTRQGIVSKGERKADHYDVIILATGFNILGDTSASLPAFPITGRAGQDLREYWHQKEGFKAHRGASVAGFPNLFLNLGIPYAGGTSWYETADLISAQIVQCLKTAQAKDCGEIEVRSDAVDRYMDDMEEQLAWSIHQIGSCASSNSYYYDENGKNPLYTPETPAVSWAQAIDSVVENYEFRPIRAIEKLAKAS